MKLIKEVFGFLIFVVGVCAALFVFKNVYLDSQPAQHSTQTQQETPEALDEKSETLKKYLVANGKPQRIEITNLSKRFDKDVQNFKKLKIPQDKNSNFYLSIQFFTDESDNNAPLIAQIRFIEIKSGNTIKEDSINLY